MRTRNNEIKCLVLQTRDAEKGFGRETRVFCSSPITIGAALGNAVRVEDPRVAAHEGLLFFTSSSIKYRDCALGAIEPPAIVVLPPGSQFRIGPLEISARFDEGIESAVPDDVADVSALIGDTDRVLQSVGAVARAVGPESTVAMVDVAVRALQVLGVLADVAAELRWYRRSAPPEHVTTVRSRPSLCSLDVIDYLLDPDCPVMNIDELRDHLISLTRSVARTFWMTMSET